MAVVGPRLAETDVSEANGAPGEDGGETRERQQPIKHDGAGSVEVDVSQRAEDEDSDNRGHRPARLVDVGENLGRIALLSQGSEGTRSTVNTRHTNRQNRHKDDNVHEVIEAHKASVLADKHERRRLDIRVRGLGQQGRVVRGNQQTDEEEAKNVEDGNTPEDLLDSTGQRLDGVLSLSSGETNQFGSGEGEGGSDEDGAEALETVAEGTGVIPQLRALVGVVTTAAGATAEDEDEADDHEDDGGTQLNAS